jgi:hypothetical protein
MEVAAVPAFRRANHVSLSNYSPFSWLNAFSQLFGLFYQYKFHSKILGFHGDDYEDCHLMSCYAMWLLQEPTFQRNAARFGSRYC